MNFHGNKYYTEGMNIMNKFAFTTIKSKITLVGLCAKIMT